MRRAKRWRLREIRWEIRYEGDDVIYLRARFSKLSFTRQVGELTGHK